ncbi:MAG: Flp pilus assembly complex ATPase component TadA [Vicinamibacteria bacterium]|nr:Flp pilus assembly complex ATPase component TadA [Vicinamibacteria bacterium]
MADNQGRVTPPQTPTRRHAPQATTQTAAVRDILPLLVARKRLTAEQAEKVDQLAKLERLSSDDAIVRLGLMSEAQLTQALAEAAGLRFQRINPLDLDLEVVTSALPAGFARKNGLVAIGQNAGNIVIAVHDPFAPFPEEDIRRVTGLGVEKVVAPKSDIEAISRSFYDLKTSLKTAEAQLRQGRIQSVDISNQEFLSSSQEDLDPAAAPVVKALDHILSYAFEQRASDIHFEPKRELTLVRLRIDGILHDVHVIPKIVYQAVVSRVKLLSGMNLAEKRRPQDGRIKREEKGREVELRVSTMPTAFGEKAVLRIFDPDILMKGIEELGFAGTEFQKVLSFIERPNGIVLVTGPTGSGKTTTLYSLLRHLSKPEVNIVTIEDPVEMVIEDFNQVSVRPQIDVTFATALRTVLRQDPDIVMVGEIRDSETADHAVQAALTGHLVLSTLHTNDAPSSITRLLDLDVPQFLVTSTLVGVIAQRLVRTNCPSCLIEHLPTDEEIAALRVPREKLGNTLFKTGAGCLQCRQTGYSGRDGIYEIMAMSDKIRLLVAQGSSSVDIRKTAREEGLRSLRESAFEKVVRGRTTVAELVRVTGK